LWQTGEWFFHLDNAPAHTALSVQRFLTKNGMTPLPHPPYSPDLAPCYFFLFPRMQSDLKGKHFADVEDVKKKMTEALKGITSDEFKNVLSNGKNVWTVRATRCHLPEDDNH
jgi:transposase